MSDLPVVFMSHASEDKDRFVLDFARRLRERGVNVWLDRWEMYPGDSLVDKIFNEGIKAASAVIIILSRNSVTKSWVREELDAAVVRRINAGCKLIPVVIDDCEIPEVLKATVWEKIENVQDYGASLDRIVSAILGNHDKPILGKPPAYTFMEVRGIPGLTKADFLVFREFAQRALAWGGDIAQVPTDKVRGAILELGISKEDFKDSCTVLCSRFLLKPANVMAPEPPYYWVTEGGLELYLQDGEPEFWSLFEKAAFAIVNEGIRDSDDLGRRLGIDRLLARFILLMMRSRDFIRTHETFGAKLHVDEILPNLRRQLQADRFVY